VNAGTLLVNGVLGGTTITANAGTTLGGDGSILGAVALNGATLAPGASTGVLDLASTLLFGASAKFAVEIGGATPGLYDQANALGAVSINSSAQINLTLVGGFNPASVANPIFYVLTRGDALPFPTAFANAAEGALIDFGGGFSGNITYQANWTGDQASSALGGGNDVAVYNLVPEPGSAIFILGGLAAVAGTRRSRRRALWHG
jgi:hypothetical protein